MFDFTKIFFAEAKECCAVKLGVAADVIVGVWVEFLPILVAPVFRRIVPAIHIDGLRIPVRFLTRDVVATFDQEDPFAGRGQTISECASARAGADDDHVVVVRVVHFSSLAVG